MADPSVLKKTLAEFESAELHPTLGLTQEQLDVLTPSQMMGLVRYKAGAEAELRDKAKSVFQMQRQIPTVAMDAKVILGDAFVEGKTPKTLMVTPDEAISKYGHTPDKLLIYQAYQREQDSFGISRKGQMNLHQFLSSDTPSMKEYTMYRYLGEQENAKILAEGGTEKDLMDFDDYKTFISELGRSRAGTLAEAAAKTLAVGKAKQELAGLDRLTKTGFLKDIEKEVVKAPDFEDAVTFKLEEVSRENPEMTATELFNKARKAVTRERVNDFIEDTLEGSDQVDTANFNEGKKGWDVKLKNGKTKFIRAM